MASFKTADVIDAIDNPIETELVSTWRWGHVQRVIFEHEGKTYATSVHVHSQEGWEPFGDEVDVDEVRQVEKIIKVWEAVS